MKLKKQTNCVLEFNQSQLLKLYVEFNIQKRIKAEKNGDKDAKALYRLINNDVYGKTMKNVRSRINVKLVSNKKYYFKLTSKPNYMSRKIWDNDLLAIRKKYYNNSSELVVGQMKDETADVVIKEFVELKPKMYSYVVDNSSDHKKSKGRE